MPKKKSLNTAYERRKDKQKKIVKHGGQIFVRFPSIYITRITREYLWIPEDSSLKPSRYVLLRRDGGRIFMGRLVKDVDAIYESTQH